MESYTDTNKKMISQNPENKTIEWLSLNPCIGAGEIPQILREFTAQSLELLFRSQHPYQKSAISHMPVPPAPT